MLAGNSPATVDVRTLTTRKAGLLSPAGRRALLFGLDLIIVIASVLGALAVWADRANVPFSGAYVRGHWVWFPILGGMWLLAAVVNGLYSADIMGGRRDLLRRLLRAEVMLVALYLIMYFVAPPKSLPRLLVLYYAAISTPLLFVARVIVAQVFTQPAFRRRTLIVGAGWAGHTAVDVIQEHLQDEYVLLGLLDDDLYKRGMIIKGVPVLGTGADLLDLVKINDADLLLVAITRGISSELFANILACQQAGVSVMSLPTLYERALERTPVHHLPEQWFMEFDEPDLVTQLVKRAIDLVFSMVGILGCCVLLPPVALAIVLESGRPILYSQERSGRNGKPFRVYKLRSMVQNAEAGGAQWSQKGDPRITRVGGFIRKTRIDELPQIYNVLRGEMSLIGPRPERPEFVSKLQEVIPYYRSRLSVRPGLTGWAQVCYRYGNTVEDARIKLEYDLYYIKHQSISLDISILLRTVGVVLRMGGQ